MCRAERFPIKVRLMLLFCLIGLADRFGTSISTLTRNPLTPFSDISALVLSVLRGPPTVCLIGLHRCVGGGAGGNVGRKYATLLSHA